MRANHVTQSYYADLFLWSHNLQENTFLTPIVCEVCQKVTLVVEAVLRYNVRYKHFKQQYDAALEFICFCGAKLL